MSDSSMDIPSWAEQELRDWVDRGVLYSDFLRAVVENDLMRAVSKADLANRRILSNYTMWIYNMAPEGCHGSREKTKAWHEAGGCIGIHGESYYRMRPDKVREET